MILSVLVATVVGIVLVQFRFNPAVLQNALFSPSADQKNPTAPPAANKSFAPLPMGLAPLTTIETFEPYNLSEKIDGKAELYLSAGFIRLDSQRFENKDGSGMWVEAYVYDMGNGQNAFSVFSAQRREDSRPLPIAQHSYSTPNAIFLVHGRYYVELIASEASERMLQPMLMLAQNFIDNTRTKTAEIDEMKLFPRDYLVTDSISLIASDAFGYGGLDKVYTAEYERDGSYLMAYISYRRTSDEAENLASSYRNFLMSFGGQQIETKLSIQNAEMVEILETYEVIFSCGRFLAGVREADDRGQAEALAIQLYHRIRANASNCSDH
jgi:hypothetical protein